MKSNLRKTISFLLVFVQIIALFPLGMTTAKAENAANSEMPVLNETIVGTVQFQAFNFLGENTTGNGRNDYSDGKDYTSTFYYTDDYFAPSAINEKADQTTMLWTDLDNMQLASCSAAFAFASFTSNIGNVLTNTEYSGRGSWENTEYSNKDSNVKSFLGQCKFEHVETFGLTEKPTIDSIGYTIAHKTIHVWDEVGKTNKDYTLIAVGVRGAGYDSEWANNVTIGNPNSSGHEMPGGRHWGFDDGAKTVCAEIQRYLSRNTITGEVKYWVTGFSRAAAVANLVAGYLTDGGSTYLTEQRNVFAYTWECPQAASTSENALNYKNIHNIINPMDAVPKVSPTQFGHQRLGIDYQMPYYGNMPNKGTTNSDKALNKSYYERMQTILGTIATAKKSDGSADPVVTAVANFPYNTTVPVYTITGTKLITDAAGGNLGKNFGTEAVSARDVKIGDVYMDKFIDNLIDVFLTSKAWSGGTGQGASPTDNLSVFINDYQADFRALLGYLLDYSGPAFLGMVDELLDAVGDQIGSISLTNWWNNTGFALAFARFYLFNSGKDTLISRSQDMAVTIVNRMTSDYPDSANGSSITRTRMNTALRNAVKLVINLYAQEKTAYGSQYFGTSLHFLNEILCTHLQETVLSWIMSLDSNHMNRSCRTVMVPRGSSAELHLYRPDYLTYDGDPEEDVVSTAPIVASWNNGEWSTKDDRISYTASGDYIFIRYPASMEIRTDITANNGFNLNQVAVDDYITTSETVNVSSGKSQFYSALPSSGSSDASGYRYITLDDTRTNANNQNSLLDAYGALTAGDTLHVIVNGTDQYNDPSAYTLIVDKAPKTVVAEYSIPTVLAENVSRDALPTGAEGFEWKNGSIVWTGGTATSSQSYESVYGSNYNFMEYELSSLSEIRSTSLDGLVNSIRTRQNVTVTPAANVYYDDGLQTEQVNAVSTAPDYKAKVEAAEANEIAGGGETQISFRFTGTRIDVYTNTNSDTGSVNALLLNADGTEIYKQNGKMFSVRISGKSASDMYNVPVVSFSGMDYGTYTLVLVTPPGKTTRIDGVRVYDDRVTQYLSLRETLIDPEKWISDSTVSGAVYLDGGSTTTDIAAYKKDGPKGEVYLSSGNGIAFQIEDFSSSASYRIGLSAVSGSPVRVQLNSEDPFWISTATHMFYDLHPTDSGEVVIRNLQGGILSVTDIEMTPVIRTSAPKSIKLSVSPALMRFAASLSVPAEPEETAEPSPEVTEEPTPDVTPEPTTESTPEPTSDISSMIQQLLSSFVSSLFGSISRLFGN